MPSSEVILLQLSREERDALALLPTIAANVMALLAAQKPAAPASALTQSEVAAARDATGKQETLFDHEEAPAAAATRPSPAAATAAPKSSPSSVASADSKREAPAAAAALPPAPAAAEKPAQSASSPGSATTTTPGTAPGSADAPSIDTLRLLGREVQKKHGREALAQAIREHGGSSFSEIPVEKRSALHTVLTVLLAKAVTP